MKKITSVLFVCFSILFFAACKKDSGGSGSSYYIKATIGGTEKTFTSTPLVVKFDQSGTFSLVMSAGGAGGSSLEGLALQITQTSGAIATGTYTDGGSSDYVVGGNYNPGTTDVSAIYGAGLQLSATAPLTIVITEITDSKVSGTFSGEYFDNSGTGSNSLMITNGEFNLPIQ